MYKISDDPKLKAILDEIRKNLPEEKTYYKVEQYTLNEYRSRANLTNKRVFYNLDDLMKAYNKSHSKYKKIFMKITNLGYVEITKSLNIEENFKKEKEDSLTFGYSICYSLLEPKIKKQIHYNNFINMYNNKKNNYKMFIKLFNIGYIEIIDNIINK